MIHSIIWLLFLGKNIVHFIIFNCIFFLLKATTDLDIREASFNNESKELEESHKEEVEQLIGKNEALSQRIGELSEKMARQTAECDSKLDEMFKAKKAEVGDLRSQLADKESQVKSVAGASRSGKRSCCQRQAQGFGLFDIYWQFNSSAQLLTQVDCC